MSIDAKITSDTTLKEIERRLAQTRLAIVMLRQDDGEFVVRLQLSARFQKRFYYGRGKTIAAALTDAFDEYVIDMASMYARA